jgi:hypothetical protein
MIRVKVDRRGLERKLKAMANRSPAARREAVIIMTGEVVRRALGLSPTDTNRYYRGWALAGNAAGVGHYLVPPLRKASWSETILARLAKEERYWDFVVQRYEGQGRADKWYARAVRERTKARTELDRFAENLAESGGAIIGFNIIGGGRRPTVRHKVYGGEGRVVTIGERTVVELHNKEPHASLVEWRYGIMRRASSGFRGVGLRKGGRHYIRKMQDAARAA